MAAYNAKFKSLLIELPVLRHTQGHILFPLDGAFLNISVGRNLAFYQVWGISKHAFQPAASSLLYPLTLAPVFFISRAVLTLNNNTMNIAEADVLGTGGEALLFLTLLVTPTITVTGQRWFISLRRWYGIMFAITVIADGIIASGTLQIGDPRGGVIDARLRMFRAGIQCGSI